MKPSKLQSVLSLATWLNLAAVLIVCVLIMGIGERWWFSAALSYLPRLPWLVPSVVLSLLCLVFRPKLAIAAIVPLVLVAVGLMGLCMPVAAAEEGEHTIRLASCNIQHGDPRFGSVVIELQRLDADVMFFQECDQPRPRMAEKWPEFHAAHLESFDVTSRWPVTALGLVDSEGSHRFCAGVFRIDHPERPFVLVNVHLSTARHGLSHLRNTSLSLSEAARLASDWQLIRETEIRELAKQVEGYANEPLVLAGDFNQPWSGQFVQDMFGDMTNAFDVAGTGYGYTAPTDSGRLWPNNCPWLRIDHIAVNDQFGVTHAEIGTSAGSDHRLIAADLTW